MLRFALYLALSMVLFLIACGPWVVVYVGWQTATLAQVTDGQMLVICALSCAALPTFAWAYGKLASVEM